MVVHVVSTRTLEWFPNECARAAKEGWESLCRSFCGTGCTEHYLYFKQGSIVIAQEKPEGYELGCPERVPVNLTKEQLTTWIYDRTKRLPVL